MSPLMLAEASPAETGFMALLVILAALVAVAVVVFIIAAVISILTSRADGAMKVVWLVLVFLAPLIGALLWFLVGRSRA